uniref:Dol-P-Glc:Glc(2)Man(9)GlcNAc(2)-PP-Dol alpha-1,2-glucosyltransferase n=1 Tax=Aegilops tauschii TaxID=37682 RepID=M8BQM8_AEGTA
MGRLAVAAAVAAWAIPIAALVDSIVPDPYMDEIFHVPQAQHYCRGDFLTWDPMITTPPGLYYISLAYLASLFPGAWAIKVAEAFDPLCTTALLRSTNVIMAMVCGVLVHDLLLCIKPGIGKTKATAYAILVALYPVHWFFTFLYYTDVASLASVLAMYLSCLKKRFWVSALFGALSILFRQTNVIWMIFFAANGAIAYVQDLSLSDCLSDENSEPTDKSRTEVSDRDSKVSALGLRRRRTNHPISERGVVSGSTKSHTSFTEELFDIGFKIWNSKCKVLITFAPFAIVLVAFGAFIIWNGGIVLGKSQPRVWVVSFVFSVALVLVPAPLVEFRYYTIPLVILVLNSPVIGNGKLLALGSAYAAVDLFTLAMFLFRPFHWGHEPGTQRFMW